MSIANVEETGETAGERRRTYEDAKNIMSTANVGEAARFEPPPEVFL